MRYQNLKDIRQQYKYKIIDAYRWIGEDEFEDNSSK